MGEPAETRVVERRVKLTVEQLTRRIHKRLGEMDLTTKELATRMGFSRPRLSKLINGEELTAEMFERLTVALEVDEAWWQKPVGIKFAKKPNPARAMLERVRRISRR